jgi:hypothetical protein
MRYRCGVRATVVVSDDPRSSSRIARFAAGSDPWIVAVRMISEGVDIPRLRIGVYATTTATELFFRQAVGRFVRWTRGVPRQRAYLFIPDDPRLRMWAAQIATTRRHCLAKPSSNGDDDGEAADDTALDELRHEDDRADQLSLFAPLSAVVTDADVSSVFDADDETLVALDRLDRASAAPELTAVGGRPGAADGEDVAGFEIALPVLTGGGPGVSGPGVSGVSSTGVPSGDGTAPAPSPRQQRIELRERNQKLVQELVWSTGWTHAAVNARLNRVVGLRRIDEATVDQLGRRAREAERWLATG